MDTGTATPTAGVYTPPTSAIPNITVTATDRLVVDLLDLDPMDYEDEIAAYEEKWPIGTRERLAFALLRTDPWASFAPGARGILISFYSFAAFAKLNRGFFDPTV